MEGKLVKQDPNDLSAIAQLQSSRIKIEKAVKNKELRKEKYVKAENTGNYPQNWAIARLKEICTKNNTSIKRGPFGSSITKSMFVPKGKNTFKVYEQGNAIRKNISYGSYYITREKYETLKSFKVEPGDIIISCAGTIGKAYILPPNIEQGIINQALLKLTLDTDLIDKKFFLLELESISTKLKLHSKGSAIKNLASLKFLKNEVEFPLPPLEEQRRIVAKIEKLMPLVDEYAESYNQLTKIDANFNDRMKQSILKYAMEGKLVKQDSNDEPASVLVKQIADEKARLIKEKKIKRTKKLPAITDEEKPFDIPDSWEWVRFGNLVNFNLGKTPKKTDNIYWSNGEIPWVSISDMQKPTLNKTKLKISNVAMTEVFKGKIVPTGTLLMSFKLSIGKVTILNLDAVHNEAIIDIHPYVDNNNIQRNYLFWVLPFISNMSQTNTAIKGKTLNKTLLNSMLIPLPPIEEQKRIVEKIDQFMKLLDNEPL
ncbi:restriction endonuclease subunit S [Limosilactobacillus agrestis]|uniref:Restriction endonuclease subunit S n=2 Tax=Limosilactobacillus agrestis TaxID=2759748 RepID=A0ABS8R6F9_9LACO|nr:restriction endonuclease subunit S [Limosilactobacillus agrestis]MBB1099588.1 restriction endonuclease subunit S [Limosilactobacillus agrestis]MCD7130357.1 restriction endonuclease subunit S [Limosilactobacillus agrestis]